MEGDGDDVDQQKPLPRLITYKEAALEDVYFSVGSIANIDKTSARQATLCDMISNMQSCHAMIHSQHIIYYYYEPLTISPVAA